MVVDARSIRLVAAEASQSLTVLWNGIHPRRRRSEGVRRSHGPPGGPPHPPHRPRDLQLRFARTLPCPRLRGLGRAAAGLPRGRRGLARTPSRRGRRGGRLRAHRRRVPRRGALAALRRHHRHRRRPHRPPRVRAPRRRRCQRREGILRRRRRLRRRLAHRRAQTRLRGRQVRPPRALARPGRLPSRHQARRQTRGHHRHGQHRITDRQEAFGFRLHNQLHLKNTKSFTLLHLLPDRPRPRFFIRRAHRRVRAERGDPAHRQQGRPGRPGKGRRRREHRSRSERRRDGAGQRVEGREDRRSGARRLRARTEGAGRARGDGQRGSVPARRRAHAGVAGGDPRQHRWEPRSVLLRPAAAHSGGTTLE